MGCDLIILCFPDKDMKKKSSAVGMMGGNVNSLFSRPEKSWRPAAILLLFEVCLKPG
jgi:hypothetical protein